MSFSVIHTCDACGTQNRVGADHLADTGRCAECKAELPPVSEPLEVDAAAFDEIVNSATVPVFVDFWATWCPPCRMAAPHVHALAQNMAGRALVLKVDTEAHPEVAARYQVQAIPNFLVLKDGQVVFQQAGLVPAAQMQAWIEQSVGAAG